MPLLLLIVARSEPGTFGIPTAQYVLHKISSIRIYIIKITATYNFKRKKVTFVCLVNFLKVQN